MSFGIASKAFGRTALKWLFGAAALVLFIDLLDASGELRRMRDLIRPGPTDEQLRLLDAPTFIVIESRPAPPAESEPESSVVAKRTEYYRLKVGHRVGTLLNAALAAAGEGNWAEAMRNVRAAQEISGASAFDVEKTREVLAWLYVKQGDAAAAVAVYRRLVDSKLAPPEVLRRWLQTAAQLEVTLKDSPQAIEAGP